MKIFYIFLITLIYFNQNLSSQTFTSRSILDHYSMSSCYVEMKNKGKYLGNATGFFVKIKEDFHFITNNHVAGGELYIKDYYRRKGKMPPKDSIPDTLFVRVYNKQFGGFSFKKIPTNNSTTPIYKKYYDEFQNRKNLLDVVSFKMPTGTVDTSTITYFVFEHIQKDMVLIPATELFILGFPINTGQNSLYPIWKRATIASEPNLDSVDVSVFIVDATTRPGMSGSPVIYRGFNYLTREAIMHDGLSTFLVGIYFSQDQNRELGGVIKLNKIFDKLNE